MGLGWAKRTLPPEQHEMNGAMELCQRLLGDERVDALSREVAKQHLADMQQRRDLLCNTRCVT